MSHATAPHCSLNENAGRSALEHGGRDTKFARDKVGVEKKAHVLWAHSCGR